MHTQAHGRALTRNDTGTEGGVQRALIHKAAPADVDEETAAFHAAELRAGDHVAGTLAARCTQDDEVRGGQQAARGEEGERKRVG